MRNQTLHSLYAENTVSNGVPSTRGFENQPSQTPQQRTAGIATGFLQAIRSGNLPAVHHTVLQHRWLLESNLGVSPILLALRHRKRAVANVLAFMGKKLDILEASALGMDKRVQEWIGFHTATIHQRDPFGWTALHYASLYGHANVVKTLLEAGANPDAEIPGTHTRAIDISTHPRITARLKTASLKARELTA
jgi:hypothetical protein